MSFFYYPLVGILSYQLLPLVFESTFPESKLVLIHRCPLHETKIVLQRQEGLPLFVVSRPKASPKLTKAQREALKVSQEQHEIIVGGLLGDYYASRPNGPNRNTRLAITRHNLGYLLSVYSLLSPLISQSEPTPYY